MAISIHMKKAKEKARKEQYRVAKRLADKGRTHAEIAPVLGVSRQRVGQILSDKELAS